MHFETRFVSAENVIIYYYQCLITMMPVLLVHCYVEAEVFL